MFIDKKIMEKTWGGLGGGTKPPRKNFHIFDKIILAFFIKFGGVNEHLFVIWKNTGGLGDGAPLENFWG